jgi:hypothetical protein
MRVLVALAIAVGAVGCFNPTYQDPACSPAGECPDGLVCGPDNICRSTADPIDAAELDAMIDAPDGMAADANVSVCNVRDPLSCPSGWKCTATMEAGGTIEAHCVPDGTIALGGFCEPWLIEEEVTGYRHDDCRNGSLCVGNECRAFCSVIDGPAACTDPYACVGYGILPNDPELGVCDPTCDPVTQVRLTDGAQWCGSIDTVLPEQTCVGQPNGPFFCAPTQDTSATHGRLIGQPVYLNACAAGFMPYMQEPGSTGNAICAAMCRPQETSMTMQGGAQGQPGSGYTCPDRGAFTAECRFVSMIQNSGQPGFGDFDSVGYCFDYQNYPGMDSCTTAGIDPQANGCFPY